MTMMPSTAESMIDRQRNSLVRSATSARFPAVRSRAMAVAPTTDPVWDKVKVDGHADEVLAAVDGL